MKQRTWVLGLLMAVWALGGSAVQAAVPGLIPVQGVLSDGQGVPRDGAFSVQFSLHTSESGGGILWEEGQAVTVTQGFFTVFLGEQQPLDHEALAAADQLWLQIRVEGDAAMPRVRIGAVPFVARADRAPGRDIPQGLSALFAGACPAGWTRATEYDGRVLRGAATGGGNGGAAVHTHSWTPGTLTTSSNGSHQHDLDPPGTSSSDSSAHSHGVITTVGTTSHTHTAVLAGTTGNNLASHTHNYCRCSLSFNGGTSAPSNSHAHSVDLEAFTTSSSDTIDVYDSGVTSALAHSHSLDLGAFSSEPGGSHNHPLQLPAQDSSEAANLPPVLDLVICRKASSAPLDTPKSLSPRIQRAQERNRALRRRIEALQGLVRQREASR